MAQKEDLRIRMRELWDDHAFYTQLVVMADVNSLNSLSTYLNRLLRNQDDIGNYYGNFFGQQAANNISQLLRTHIGIAVDIVNTAKAGDTSGVNDALNRANQNNMDIVSSLNGINPSFDINQIYQFMDMHIKFLTQAASSEIHGDYTGEINALDTNIIHLRNFADYQSNVIASIFGLS